jgi:hypothetical protein
MPELGPLGIRLRMIQSEYSCLDLEFKMNADDICDGA